MPKPQADFSFDQSVRGIVERIAFQLGDAEPGDEFQTFDDAWIMARVRDTFKWLQQRRPNLFATEVSFDASETGRQELPEECDKLIEILSLRLKGKTYPVLMSDFDVMKNASVYSKLQPSCDPCIYHASISEVDERRYWISPAAPGATVTASCSDSKRFFDDPDKELDCDIVQWINAVVEYVLYQAHLIQSGDPSSANAAQQHMSTFFDLAPVQRRANSQA